MYGGGGGGYGSEFEEPTGSGKRKSTWRSDSISQKVKFSRTDHGAALPARSNFIEEYEKEERKSHFAKYLTLNAYQRHQKLVYDYIRYYGGKLEDLKRTGFIWDDGDEEIESDWGKKLAKRYYDKLFKEYCICDLSRYKENKFAMRWRVEKEVVSGKGQFVCGARKCENKESMRSWEVNFGYIEHGEKKNALVKLRLCPDCSYKLNYHKKHKKVKKKKKKHEKKTKKKKKKKKRSRDTSSSSSSSSSSSDTEEEVDCSSEAGPSSRTTSESQSTDRTEQGDIWKKPVKEDVEKTREEEFDEYLDDLFM